MTYNVFGGMLNPTQSISLTGRVCWYLFCVFLNYGQFICHSVVVWLPLCDYYV